MTKIKRLTAFFVAVVLCLSLLTLAACPGPDDPTPPGPGGTDYVANPETRPLTMSIQNPDRVFNPFFSTSAMDSNIIGMTQIGMLTSTAKGEPKCGDDEPVAVKDYEFVESEDGQHTVYRFIIKNGIRFSDGEPLTIKDVLFNLYVYLDPVYTGSSTIYSTDIVGLQAYRQQDPYASSDDASAFEEGFILKAAKNLTDLINFVRAYGIYTPNEMQPPKPSQNYTDEQILSYWNKVTFTAKEFRKELESDWNNVDLTSYEKEGYTAKWQVFLYQDGGMDFYLRNPDNTYWKDEVTKSRKVDSKLIAAQEAELDEYLQEFNLAKNEDNIRDWAINAVYESYFPIAVNLDKGVYDESVFNTKDVAEIVDLMSEIQAQQFSAVAGSWATAETLLNQLIAEAKSEQFDSSNHPVKTIEGIKSSAAELEKVTTDFHGNNLGEPHDVLEITINNIDPKAIWNFSFNIAPLHYYSGTFEGVDYVKTFDAAEGNFGFKYGSKDFFDKVINSPDKVGLPVGAGVYMASTVNGGKASSSTQFFDSNVVYYERNPYFYTLFGDDQTKNAKIKYFRYKVVESDQVINALTSGNIDVGEPNATPENSDQLDAKGIDHVEVMTAGYGYVGINPRFVPDITVRRAIMKAMNRQKIKDNYYYELCEIINRPMSKANWAFPEGATVYSTKYTYADGIERDVTYDYRNELVTGEEIENMIQQAGYTKNGDGIYEKRLADGSNHKLKYKFTIAGSSTDHPAYAMFIEAQNLLNQHGFDITVVTSQAALSDLWAGKLAVWAAAWSSTIDPDMYQVYHKDSNASSVNNWGYPQIKANATLYGYEQQIINELSDLIEDGRTTNVQDERVGIYSDALDKVMELAVELPTYQRSDMTAYNGKMLDRATMIADPSPYEGLFSRIWEVDYLKVAK